MIQSHLELIASSRRPSCGNPASRFTPRQREIQRLTKRGLSGASIARALGVSSAFVCRQRVVCNYRAYVWRQTPDPKPRPTHYRSTQS